VKNTAAKMETPMKTMMMTAMMMGLYVANKEAGQQ